jgi:hypothetical protein
LGKIFIDFHQLLQIQLYIDDFKINSGGSDMNSNLGKPSLVSYLKPADAKFYLKMSMTANGSPDHKRPGFPFLIVSDTDPLALILEAKVLSDAGAKIKRVFLLTQKDEYHFVKDEIYPVNNQDIDRAWQQLFTFLNAQNQNDSIILLEDQVDQDGKLLPWSPLFYCQHQQIFFQPPCPTCGFPLEMSSDDDLLSSLGLQPYSTSLRRYLFCPHCYDTRGESDFYVRALTSSDPAILKDQQDLIGGFDQLAGDGKRNANIPCLKCDSFQHCYETGQLAMTRIVPISFYPFYMIALPAPSMHLLDLLPLLAGADVDELASRLQAEGQRGRLKYLTNFGKITSQKTNFFFNKDEKFFLEVLYLKLSLLGELAQLIFSGLNTFKYPDLGLSIDRIWARVAEQCDMLPHYWNFKLQVLGIGLDTAPSPSLSKLPPSYGLYFLGSLWFYVLLVNIKHDVSEVYKEVAKVVDDIGSKDSAVSEDILNDHLSAVFSPQNIFWNPNQKTVHAGWTTLWAGALNLGFLLFKCSMSHISQWSEAEFWQKFEAIRDTIKNTLFGSEAEVVRPSPTYDTRAIHDILMKITSKWRSDVLTRPLVPERGAEGLPAERPKIARAGAGISEDLLTKETVILSPEDLGEEKPSDKKIEETVLLKPQEIEQAEPSAPASKITNDLPETVILTHDDDVKAKEFPPSEPSESDIPETVILSPQGPPASPFDSDQKRSAEDDSSEPTKQSLSKGPKGPRAEKKPIDMKDKDDDLPETVIIDSKKPKNGH